MKKLVIEPLFDRAWDLAKKHWLVFVSLIVLLILINIILEKAFAHEIPNLIQYSIPEDPEDILVGLIKRVSLLNCLEALISLFFVIVIMRMGANAIRTGELLEGEAFSVGFKRYVVAVCVGLVNYLVYFFTFLLPILLYFYSPEDMPVGIVCYIVFSVILGIFLGVRLSFVQMSVAVDNVGFGEAFSRSWNMTKGNFWAIIMLFIVTQGIMILGLLACCVGVLFSTVIVNFVYLLAYFELKGDDQLEDVEEAAEVVEP